MQATMLPGQSIFIRTQAVRDSVSRMFLKGLLPAVRQVSEATRRHLGKEWEVEGPRSVRHAAWPDVLAYTIRGWRLPEGGESEVAIRGYRPTF